MKVLVLIEHGAPSRYWEAALPLLRSKGIDASFATVRDLGPLSSALEERDVPVTSFDAVTSRDYPAAAWRLSKFLSAEKFDIVHACESIPASISGVSSYLGRNAVRLFHRQHNACPQRTRLFHNLANKTSDFMMTCSASTKDYAAEVDGFDREKISVAYNGINELRAVMDDDLGEIRKDLGISGGSKVISIVGRLDLEKGHPTLFKAAENVAASLNEDLHIVVAGRGSQEENLRELAASLKRVTVHFTGFHDDVAPWFLVGDIIVMPSTSEPFGLVAAEAMSSGRPLIACGVDGLLEVVEDEVSGLLVPPDDDESLARAMLRVFQSTELATRLVTGGQKRVRDSFSMESMVDGWIACYSSILERSKNG
ncbi:N/A [soil metagenome]